jgi:hypothetical protein
MNSSYKSPGRRKAVWGPKRLVSALLIAFTCIAPTVADAKTHFRHASARKPGRPGSFVKFYKGLDFELANRSENRNGANNKTRVIVVLKPGAELRPEFNNFVRPSDLGLINGRVLELPNGLLKRVADQPGVLTVHFDRPIQSHN